MLKYKSVFISVHSKTLYVVEANCIYDVVNYTMENVKGRFFKQISPIFAYY